MKNPHQVGAKNFIKSIFISLPRTFTTCVYLSHALTTVNAPNIQALPIWGLRGSHSDGIGRTDRQSMQWVLMYILAEEQREHTVFEAPIRD